MSIHAAKKSLLHDKLLRLLRHDTTYSTRGGEVILNGGMRLEPKDFTPVNGDAAARLTEDARENVVPIDLTALDLNAGHWGKTYSLYG